MLPIVLLSGFSVASATLSTYAQRRSLRTRYVYIMLRYRIGLRTNLQRHLFVTDEVDTIPIKELIAPCFVVTDRSLSDDEKRQAWLYASATHFYVRYRFSTANPTNWADRIRMTCNDLPVCHNCFAAEHARGEAFQNFMASQKRRPLRTFDPFSGVGAFSLAMEGKGGMQTCQAVEISPSAAQALRFGFTTRI